MKRIYIAGPMRGIPLFNFPAFDAAAASLRSMGWEPVNPADLDRQHGFNPATDSVTPEFLLEAMRRDLDAITRVDAVALLPGWENSRGALAEIAVARWRGIPAFILPDMRPLPSTLT